MMRCFKLILIAFLISFQAAQAIDVPKNFDYREYMYVLDMDYVGMNYNKAIKINKPLILVFASGRDVAGILAVLGIGFAAYQQFEGKYNLTVMNKDKSVNRSLIRKFGVEKVPTVYIVDGKFKKSFAVDEQCFRNSKCLNPLLQKYLDYRGN